MRLKKLLTVLLSVVVLVGVLPMGTFTVGAATTGTTGDCTWTRDGTVLTISGNGAMGNYFSSRSSPWGTSITNVVIESGVTHIGNFAFDDCDSLTSVAIPNSVTSIGDSAFYNCSSLTSVTIPDGVNKISRSAFYNCSSLTSIIIPDHVVSVGIATFYGCSSLGSVTIGDSVTSIGDHAFYKCSSLTSIAIPDGVTGIGSSAFYECSSLISIAIPDSVENIGSSAFYGCSSLGSVTIGDSVTGIGEDAFSHCGSLTLITIPDSVTSIGDDAFYNCLSLKRIDVANFDQWLQIFSGKIPNGTGAWAARGMDVYVNGQRFTDLSVPNDTNYIKQACYYNLKSVENVFLPKNITVVQYCAFYGCSGIQNVFFEGTAEEWAQVVIAAGNEYLEKANVYFNCTELPGKVVSIAVSKLPDKVQYLENQEELDLTGGVLTATYENGFEQEIDLSTLSVSGFNNAVSGKQNLSVHYKDLTAAFEVGVIKKYASVLAVATLPAKVIYRLGENLELNGATVLLGYSDGTYETLDVTADMVEGFDPNKTGGQILTVRHEGVSSQFVVEVFRNGDLDGDDSVSANDLVAIRKGLISLNEYDTHYDVNQDDAVNIKDLIRLKKMMFELQA